MSDFFDAIAFGSATIDFFLESLQFGKKLTLPYDSKIEVNQKMVSSGGGGTNVSVGLSRLGLKTAVVARLGQDQFAPLIIDQLRQENVWTKLLAIQPGEKTDSSTILVNSLGKKVILVSRGPTRLESGNINWNKLKSSYFHLASLEGNLKLAKKIINHAKTNNIKLFWNPGSRELAQKDKLLPLLNKVQFLALNQKEAEELLNQKLEASSFWPKVFKLPVPLIAITQSQKGCYLVFPQEGKKIHLKAVKTRAMETTGAGDAFASGLIAGLFYQKTPKQAARWGLTNGASVVSHFGAKTGLLTKKEIKKWLKKP